MLPVVILGDDQMFKKIDIEVGQNRLKTKKIESKQSRVSNERLKIKDCPSKN